MTFQLSQNWWLILVRGILAVLFGILVLISPPLYALEVLVIIFGIYALVDGIVTLISCVTNRGQHKRWWVTVLEGIFGIALGAIALLYPLLASLALVLYFALWAIATGAFELIAAVELRKEIKGEWLLALSGVLSIVFGILVYVTPLIGMVIMVWLIGIYALLFGITLIGLSFRVRNIAVSQAQA
jgi:uncharacterized membrane protein HdeD (DUF308 family)